MRAGHTILKVSFPSTQQKNLHESSFFSKGVKTLKVRDFAINI